jgi:hypothetical protein
MPILLSASEEQKRRWLPDIAAGKRLAAFALTEPDAGSDAGGIRTTALKDGDHYVLNGTKQWITNGGDAEVYTVIGLTNPKKGPRGASFFIVEKGTPGFTAGKPYRKLGLHASDTAPLIFEDARVPAEQLIGARGQGFIQSMQVLEGGRIAMAAMAVGIAQAAIDQAVKYMKQRTVFGKTLAELNGLQGMIAEMATDVETARLLTLRAAWLKDQGRPAMHAAAMAKLFASEAAMKAASRAVQIHGGAGYITEFPVERIFRDAKLTEIGEGTSEVQRLVIAREILQLN